jgi:polyisoprenyl-teichoic acid--peptidoglycan teichoic acid transferase
MRQRWRRGALALTTVLALLLGGGAVLAAEGLLLPQGRGNVSTFLLLGSDEGPPRGGDPRSGRADGVQLLFVSGDRQHATFVSIPRDAYVAVPGRGQTRIGHCLASGPDTCVATVEQEFGLSVDGYVVTSMRGFAKAVAAFGGLTVDVPTPVFDGGTSIPQAGEQHLSGSQALTYARDRKNRGGDVARSQAQAELLALAHAEVVRSGDIRAVTDALTVLRRHSFTDLSGTQLTRYAFQAMRVPPENVERTVATGSGAMIGGASMYRLDQQARSRIADAAADGRLGSG